MNTVRCSWKSNEAVVAGQGLVTEGWSCFSVRPLHFVRALLNGSEGLLRQAVASVWGC